MICFRGKFDEAIEKLGKVQDLTHSSLGVQGKRIVSFIPIWFGEFSVKNMVWSYWFYVGFVIVAAMEALVGLHLELGQVSFHKHCLCAYAYPHIFM